MQRSEPINRRLQDKRDKVREYARDDGREVRCQDEDTSEEEEGIADRRYKAGGDGWRQVEGKGSAGGRLSKVKQEGMQVRARK